MPLTRKRLGKGLSGPDDTWQETSGDEDGTPPVTIQDEIAALGQGSLEEQGVTTPPNDDTVLNVGPADVSMGMTPSTRPGKAPPVKSPTQRGRNVGAAALALVSRVPLVGLKYLRDSAEFVIYDDQPPPSGEYAVQTLGVTTLTYDGVQQNHLLVTFKAGQLTGMTQEEDYYATSFTFGVVTDQEVDIESLLATVRAGKTIVLHFDHNMTIKFNDKNNDAIQIFAVESPYVLPDGLTLYQLWVTTTQASKLWMEVW